MEKIAAVTMPGITEPEGAPQDFSKPITIRWDPRGTPDVTGWWLCVGTLDVKEGDWNILSGDMRLNRHLTIDLSDQRHVKGLRVQLLCSVKDNDLDPPERTMVLDPIVIPSNEFASTFEALASIEDEQKQVGGHHHMPA
ncbi:MAG: hypothetical protein CAF45_016885 [Nitrospira sp. CG24E]|nr:MAG: hypothetical protein CAF45_016885 [Nitrospira sp. CG24E]